MTRVFVWGMVLAMAPAAMAGFTATNAGPIDSNGALGDATNGVFTYNHAGADFLPGTLVFSGDATSAGNGSYLSELRWQITNPALQAGSISVASGTTWTGTQSIGPITYEGLNTVFTGTSVGTWEFRAWESYDDTFSDPTLLDASWTNLSFDIQDYVPPPPWSATNYYDEASFQAALVGPYYVEDFNGYVYGSPLNGTQTSQSYGPVNGYSYNALCAGGLWSNDGALSTNSAFDTITLEFTGDPVTAVGGNLVPTDINGNLIAGDVIVILADGSQQILTNQTANSFFGFSTPIPIVSVEFTADAPVNAWVQLDHLYVGQIPEPASLLLLALGGLVALGRRR